MAPNVTSATTLFLAEAAVCPSASLKSRLSAPPAPPTPSVAPVGTPVSTPVGTPVGGKPGKHYQWSIVWRNVLAFVYLHYACLHGLFLIVTGNTCLPTFPFALLLASFGAVGITGGAHRLWAHRAYKAAWPMRLILMVFQTLAFQNHIYEWVRDHRVHHKFTDTDADPHNASRGFFFSHMGWLMVRKHPDVKIKGAGVDLSDLEQDGIVMFQKRMYMILMPLIAFVLPAYIPVALWGEDPWVAWYVCSMTRYTLSLHGTWLVNSAAHIYGMRPVDKNISPRENTFVGYIAFGEGWHNYHHVFPWDYKAAELGDYRRNLTTGFIDFFARIGWAYDLKTVSADMIRRRVLRTGDGSHPYSKQASSQPSEKEHLDHHDHHHHHHNHHHNPGEDVWGWGDKDMSQEDILGATIINKSE